MLAKVDLIEEHIKTKIPSSQRQEGIFV